ncbi:MAG TPA: protein-glutamate O-methyltransferase CheR [Vicinamibacterales bacterium]|nr:protein-glutamate O-methyltransferase CheR [Vicinamibacterales bacterium]
MIRVERDTLGVPETGLPVLRELVHERTGIFFDEHRTDLLAERLAPLVLRRGFRSYLDLYYLLKYDEAASKAAWHEVFDALAVPETYFWREMDQVRAIACGAIPELVSRAPDGVVRIWSVPCASGEEPLTIAMALNEAGWFDRARIEIYASDASPAALDRARAGRYRSRSLRALPPSLVDKYFTAMDGVFVPDQALTGRVTAWTAVNLLDADAVTPFARSQIVFCRNAFIYFSPHAVRRVVATFAATMPAGGYLCVGASESLLNLTTAFTLEELDGAFVYVKRGADA